VEVPPLKLGTSATVQLVPHFDMDGSSVAITLIKQRFVTIGTNPQPTGGAQVHIADVPWDEEAPEKSSIKYPSDLCLRKPSTDVIVVGNAVAPYTTPQRQLDVMVRVGPVHRTVRVFGPRAWYKSGIGKLVLTEPQPFESQRLQWEHAWGGSDYETDPQKPLEEPRNPNGRGVVRDPDVLENQAGPCIEDPDDPIKHSRGSYRPAGVGAIGRHWVPRRHYGGTYDQAWMEERMPLLPLDFDERFNQVAPPELITPEPLRGGERVEIVNMNPRGPVVFDLPRVRFFVGIQTADKMTEARVQLDTVLLEPGEQTVDLTWRAIVKLPRHPRDTRFVQVHEKEWV
jgi:hypothetical protein